VNASIHANLLPSMANSVHSIPMNGSVGGVCGGGGEGGGEGRGGTNTGGGGDTWVQRPVSKSSSPLSNCAYFLIAQKQKQKQ